MKVWLKLVVVLVLAGFSVSCNDDGGDGGGADAALLVNGGWSGTYGSGVAFSMTLMQSGDTVTGSYLSAGIGGSISGMVNGNYVGMTITLENGVIAEFDGNVNDARTSMSGSFAIIAGGGGNGTWSANRSDS